MYTKQLGGCFLRQSAGIAAHSTGRAPSLANAPIGVVVVAVVCVQLLSTASSIPHLWRAPKEKTVSVPYDGTTTEDDSGHTFLRIMRE